jgi:hypothetical protein
LLNSVYWLLCYVLYVSMNISRNVFRIVFMITVHAIDLLVDHWNFRGLMSRAAFHVIYWIEIDLMVYMYVLTQWLW